MGVAKYTLDEQSDDGKNFFDLGAGIVYRLNQTPLAFSFEYVRRFGDDGDDRVVGLAEYRINQDYTVFASYGKTFNHLYHRAIALSLNHLYHREIALTLDHFYHQAIALTLNHLYHRAIALTLNHLYHRAIALSKTNIDQDLQLNRTGSYIFEQMTLQELQKPALQLSNGDRWQLVQVLLDSLKQDAHPKLKQGNLSRLRGIAKISTATKEVDPKEDYVTYLTGKYQ